MKVNCCNVVDCIGIREHMFVCGQEMNTIPDVINVELTIIGQMIAVRESSSEAEQYLQENGRKKSARTSTSLLYQASKIRTSAYSIT